MKLLLACILIRSCSGLSSSQAKDLQKEKKGLVQVLRGSGRRTQSGNENGVCSRYATNGWHEGKYITSLQPTDAPDGQAWKWQECAQQCAFNLQCEFWTLQLGGNRRCLLLKDQGVYQDTGGHVEGSKDPNCLNKNNNGVCSGYDPTRSGWHEGTYLGPLPAQGPDGQIWKWEECAQQCALNSECEFWTLQLGENKRCILLKNQGRYVDSGRHIEGTKDLDCLTPQQGPNQKRGLGMWRALSCRALENHSAVSWWYSWKTTTGFHEGFCDNPLGAADNARINLGKEFVPMLYDQVPARPFDTETEKNLLGAKYLLTFNEPEREEQANLTPREAAELWPSIVTIAQEYNLELVAPCGTIDRGREWYRDWLSECRTLYGQDCKFDYTCLHAYYYPEPCDGVQPWACLGAQASNAMQRINGWYSEFGKPTWVTELGCNPWGGQPCRRIDHEEMMRQFVFYLDASDAVFRYAWFQANGFYLDFKESNTNELNWRVSWGVSCPNRLRIGEVGNLQVQDCVAKSTSNEQCNTPLIISMDGPTCYCSRDACSNFEPEKPIVRTWREVGTRDSDALTTLGELYQIL